jgi:hypothetical protein|tara:strand:+ start:5767 stop:5958 length:192 start_codon:yes stop_codon:yes gene_type:complete
LQSAAIGEIPDVRIVRVKRVAVHPTLALWLIAIVVAQNLSNKTLGRLVASPEAIRHKAKGAAF